HPRHRAIVYDCGKWLSLSAGVWHRAERSDRLGEIGASVFTSSPVSRVGAGFTCRFDFGFAEARLQGMLMKGLLVLGQLHSFKDDSRRLNYFIREYFGLAHGRY